MNPLTPDDFFPVVFDDNVKSIDSLFKKVSTIYSIIFLFDIVDVLSDSSIEFKLNGYKSVVNKLKFLEVNDESYESYYRIYEWCYEGGNLIDKIGLTRNIVSLNFNSIDLSLSELTLNAILSSFNIYQKENINQYIEIRGKVSEQLIDLQVKADSIVESYISDYKKSIFIVVSFFISVIVISVVSSGNFIKYFTFEITLLSIGFLLISLIVMFFTRWELNEQIKRYKKNYQNIKTRYKDLLDDLDINRLLNNDEDFNDNLKFIEEKKKSYTITWILSITILLIIIITLYLNNLTCNSINCILCFFSNFFN